MKFTHRGVGFIKINSDCTLTDPNGDQIRLPGICFLRGVAVTILVALFCGNDYDENGGEQQQQQYALLVEQPRVPIGQVSCLELPAGMMDDETQSVTGIAVQEIREECGIDIDPSSLVDLTDLALQTPVRLGHLPMAAVASSPGGSDAFCRYLYVEKSVAEAELDEMRGRLQGLRDHGECITLRVVPLDEVWSISGDSKAIMYVYILAICVLVEIVSLFVVFVRMPNCLTGCDLLFPVSRALFLSQQLRQQQRLAPLGGLATPLVPEPQLVMNNGQTIPQLAFGLYLVPPTEEGETIILNAIRAGYRHFDSAAFYGNEEMLGRALRKSGLPRQAFFITSKVWNDAVKEGRESVRASVQKTLSDLDFGDYLDCCLVHWPVPGHFVEAYKALEEEYRNGSIRSLGLSNFSEKEYEELVNSGIQIPPVFNQLEVSPVMYRASLINYFAERKILVSAYKPLNRAAIFDNPLLTEVSENYEATPAQVMLRWGLQKGLVLAAKTSSLKRMRENRDILGFRISEEHMTKLDELTTPEALAKREEHELMRKTSL